MLVGLSDLVEVAVYLAGVVVYPAEVVAWPVAWVAGAGFVGVYSAWLASLIAAEASSPFVTFAFPLDSYLYWLLAEHEFLTNQTFHKRIPSFVNALLS